MGTPAHVHGSTAHVIAVAYAYHRHVGHIGKYDRIIRLFVLCLRNAATAQHNSKQ